MTGRSASACSPAAAGWTSASIWPGYHVAAAVEMEPAAALSYMINLARPGVEIHFDTPEREDKFSQAAGRHLG